MRNIDEMIESFPGEKSEKFIRAAEAYFKNSVDRDYPSFNEQQLNCQIAIYLGIRALYEQNNKLIELLKKPNIN